MDQYSEVPSTQLPDSAPSRKFLPMIAVVAIILMLAGVILGFFLIKSKQTSKEAVTPSPTHRPTATPFPPPTIPMVVVPSGTISASITPGKEMSRLIFIKDGDIYQSDLTSFSLLIKNSTPAGDKLSWSPLGNFLAWRPKSEVATPSAVTIYSREYDSSFTIQPGGSLSGEIIDYTWSPDEKMLALLFRNSSYHISLFLTASPSSLPASTLIKRVSPIKQLLWPERDTIIFSGSDGISSLNITTSSATLLVNNQNVFKMKLAPNKSKLLYSVGDNKKSDLYLINIDGTNNQLIPARPAKVNMGETNLSDSILDNGFIPYAVWMPSGDKLMVGYHYLSSLPLVGIYDLTKNTFFAIAPFLLKEEDLMIDDFRLLGARIVTPLGTSPSWQLSLFTLENNSKLVVSRVIPNVHSPAFFTNNVSGEPTIQEIR